MNRPHHWQQSPHHVPSLGTNDIHLWLFDMSINSTHEAALYSLLSADEKSRCARFKFAKDRRAFTASHGFLRQTLARYLAQHASRIAFSNGAHGKPFLTGTTATTALKFNLSHSASMAILAVCEASEIGIDIEYVNRTIDWQGIMHRYFRPDERAGILALPQAQRRCGFIQQWSRKESYMKVLGHGLALAPDKFALSTQPDNPVLTEHLSSQFVRPPFIGFFDVTLPDQYSDYMACCAHLKHAPSLTCYLADGICD
jgi:4'-phosphopantetheinyl transferase